MNQILQCDSCDRGVLLCERKDKETIPYAFKCDCPAGETTKFQYPKWGNDCTGEYRPLWGHKREQVFV